MNTPMPRTDAGRSMLAHLVRLAEVILRKDGKRLEEDGADQLRREVVAVEEEAMSLHVEEQRRSMDEARAPLWRHIAEQRAVIDALLARGESK